MVEPSFEVFVGPPSAGFVDPVVFPTWRLQLTGQPRPHAAAIVAVDSLVIHGPQMSGSESEDSEEDSENIRPLVRVRSQLK